MITLYTWSTPNGRKISIALEELALPYEVRPIDITRDEQFEAAFTRISPHSMIPAITDTEGPQGKPINVFESGAILLYLAGKTGRLLPTELRSRFEAMQWLMFQVGNVGPTLGQVHHFLRFAPELIQYAIDRYSRKAVHLYRVLDKRLTQHEWIAGDTYSVADIATFPWIARHDWQGIDLKRYPSLKRWFDTMSARAAVQRGMKVPK